MVPYKNAMCRHFLPLSQTLFLQVTYSTHRKFTTTYLTGLIPMSMFDRAQGVSAVNSNFYIARGDINMQFNQQSFPLVPQTSSYPPTTDGFDSRSRFPPTDPRRLEGLPIFLAILFLADLSFFQEMMNLGMQRTIGARTRGSSLPI